MLRTYNALLLPVRAVGAAWARWRALDRTVATEWRERAGRARFRTPRATAGGSTAPPSARLGSSPRSPRLRARARSAAPAGRLGAHAHGPRRATGPPPVDTRSSRRSISAGCPARPRRARSVGAGAGRDRALAEPAARGRDVRGAGRRASTAGCPDAEPLPTLGRSTQPRLVVAGSVRSPRSGRRSVRRARRRRRTDRRRPATSSTTSRRATAGGRAARRDPARPRRPPVIVAGSTARVRTPSCSTRSIGAGRAQPDPSVWSSRPRHLRRVDAVGGRSATAASGRGCGCRHPAATCGRRRPAASTRTASSARSTPLADVAFVGGSLVPVGGHNVLEPAAAGVPVLFGPHTEHVERAGRGTARRGRGAVASPTARRSAGDRSDAARRPDGDARGRSRRAVEPSRRSRGALDRDPTCSLAVDRPSRSERHRWNARGARSPLRLPAWLYGAASRAQPALRSRRGRRSTRCLPR